MIKINGVKISFDKDATKMGRTDFNKPCDCWGCRNFYKNVERNKELLLFLHEFGIDHDRAEEVFFWKPDNEADALIHYEGYYAVLGQIEGDEVVLEKFGVRIIFTNGEPVSHSGKDQYFLVKINGDFPYLLEEPHP